MPAKDNRVLSDVLVESIAQAVVDRILQEKGLLFGGGSQPALMNIEQAALYLGRTPEAVRNLVRSGVLPQTKLDGRVQFSTKELDRVIADNTPRAR